MRAAEGGTGLNLSFGIQDRPVLEKGGTLEARLCNKPHQKVTVYIVDRLRGGYKNCPTNEAGLRTNSYPKGYEKRKLYKVWMDKSAAKILMTRGGYGCRCVYDRLDISYWEEGMKHSS